jgi:hypothetical protein
MKEWDSYEDLTRTGMCEMSGWEKHMRGIHTRRLHLSNADCETNSDGTDSGMKKLFSHYEYEGGAMQEAYTCAKWMDTENRFANTREECYSECEGAGKVNPKSQFQCR